MGLSSVLTPALSLRWPLTGAMGVSEKKGDEGQWTDRDRVGVVVQAHRLSFSSQEDEAGGPARAT